MKTIPERNKAFLGAAIGLATNVIGGLINNNKQRKALARQNRIQNRQATYQAANALTESYNNQDYVDDFQDRIEFACGGKRRRKASDGGIFSNIDWNDVATAGVNGISNILTTALMRNGGLRKR